MRLERSQTGIRSVPTGIALQAPVGEDHSAAFNAVCDHRADIMRLDEPGPSMSPRRSATVPSSTLRTRVQKAAAFLRELITAGL